MSKFEDVFDVLFSDKNMETLVCKRHIKLPFDKIFYNFFVENGIKGLSEDDKRRYGIYGFDIFVKDVIRNVDNPDVNIDPRYLNIMDKVISNRITLWQICWFWKRKNEVKIRQSISSIFKKDEFKDIDFSDQHNLVSLLKYYFGKDISRIPQYDKEDIQYFFGQNSIVSRKANEID